MDGDLLERVPEGWMLSSEAGDRLQVARSSLSRMAKSGVLTGWSVRLECSDGRRRVCLFNRRDVELLAKRRAAALRARLMRMGRSSCVIAFAHAAIALALVVNAACMVPGLAFVRFVPVLPGSSPGRGFFLGAECCKGCAQEV